ncbi:hypothetical protein [uncultured Hyphomicrobium sp.]|uniref:hypothetical protein n=1 Tax=uncultured Hyphomicrobium sp. TaxID=194373 RepID=UPI0025E5EE3D|nr:hypothetical protein [uncultured Hyphomicrobium sp.]
MRKTLLIAPALAILAAPQAALSEPRRERYVEAPAFQTEARGCYYRRGREYCGRYCYIEINGRRYCQERSRDAVPQASYYELWPAPDARRLK